MSGMLKLMALLLLLSHAVAQAALTMKTDRLELSEGETFTLSVVGDSDMEPDWSPLERDFEILGRSTSSQMSIINGQVSRSRQWQLTLSPKRTGQLTVPSLQAGQQRSKPLMIDVLKAGASSGKSRDLFIEVEATPRDPFVQAQVIYTVRLLHAVTIREGALSEPKGDNLVVERLGEDRNYTLRRQGRLYQVTERRYALFPQASGNLTLPGVVFQGQVLSGQPGARHDPFNRFFQQPATRPVRLRSNTVPLEVKPRQSSSGNWLPASKVVLTEQWAPASPEFRVGEPVTRSIRLEAHGLTAAQLPALALTPPDGIKQYADQPLLETRSGNDTLIGVREEKLAVVPEREGMLMLPEVKLSWWDTGLSRQRHAILPPQEIEVLPARHSAPSLPPAVAASPLPAPTGGLPAPSGADPWRWLSAFFALAWLLTLGLWWRQRSPSPASGDVANGDDSLKSRYRHLRKACHEGDAAAVKEALLAWARARWPDEAVASLPAMARRLDLPAQTFAQLEAILYANAPQEFDGPTLWCQLDEKLTTGKETAAKSPTGLPELYPPF